MPIPEPSSSSGRVGKRKVFQVQTMGPHEEKLPPTSGKLPRDACKRRQSSHTMVRPQIIVAAVRTDASTVRGTWGGVTTDMMMDSGSSVSLVKRSLVQSHFLQGVQTLPTTPNIHLVTASGDHLPVRGHKQAPISVGKHSYTHNFIVVNDLVAPVILGTDFLQKNALVLDFTSQPLTVYHSDLAETPDTSSVADKVCVVGIAESNTTAVTDQAAVPSFSGIEGVELPDDCASGLTHVIASNQDLFVTTPGVTNETYHSIPTIAPPVKIPPRRIPAHYRGEVEHQLQVMLARGIIEESSSPWMAPAVYTPKKLRICVDYRELNKRTKKDSYPLPLVDEVQDRL